jgi:Protein of unknown function (DUF1761)
MFAGVNYLAVLIAAIGAWITGVVWYMTIGKTWMAALRMTPEKMEATNSCGFYLPFILLFIADLLIGWTLAKLLFYLGAYTMQSGLMVAALCWLGFILTTLLVNNSFAKSDQRLIFIDGGHWLLVLLLTGTIIGAMSA